MKLGIGALGRPYQGRYHRRRRRNRPLRFLTMFVVCGTLCASATMMVNSRASTTEIFDAGLALEAVTPIEPVTAGGAGPEIVAAPGAGSGIYDAPPSAEPENTPVTGQEPIQDMTAFGAVPQKPSDFGMPAPVRTDFQGCAFLGNSRTQGLQLYGAVPGADVFAARGLMVNEVATKAFVKGKNGNQTALQALGQKEYERVYIMLGMNEMGWSSEKKFAAKYGEVIDAVREIQPEAEIIVQSILPVTKERDDKDSVFNNTKVKRYNELIKAVAEEKEAEYLDVGAGLADEDGYMPAEASADGIHLQKTYCKKWAAFLLEN